MKTEHAMVTINSSKMIAKDRASFLATDKCFISTTYKSYKNNIKNIKGHSVGIISSNACQSRAILPLFAENAGSRAAVKLLSRREKSPPGQPFALCFASAASFLRRMPAASAEFAGKGLKNDPEPFRPREKVQGCFLIYFINIGMINLR